MYDHTCGEKDGLNASLADFFIEFKTNIHHDPFVRGGDTFLSNTVKSIETRGQITSYATLLLGAQYRTHIFCILVVKDYARLIRWDRAGAVVTEPIYYDDERHLFDFFIRYDRAGREVRGHDSTVRLASSCEMEKARMFIEKGSTDPLLSITIESNCYVVPYPRSQPKIPVGRWTRASIAYDVTRDKCVFLKDSWRLLLAGIQAEGKTYATLHSHKVPNIPHCSVAGDVGDNLYHKSQTDALVDKYSHLKSPSQFIPVRHYRLVLDDIGTKLQDFRSGHEVVKAVHSALLGKLAKHWQSLNTS